VQNQATDILQNGFNKTALQTVSGMSVANCVVGIVIDNASKHTLKNEMVWIYLVTAVIISLGVCIFVSRKKTMSAIFLALLAAFPVYLGTTGANTILAAVAPAKSETSPSANTAPIASQSSMIEFPGFLQTRSWWLDEVIEEANQKADVESVNAELAKNSADDIKKTSENEFKDVDSKLDEIIKNPQNAREIAEKIKGITTNAQKNLQKPAIYSVQPVSSVDSPKTLPANNAAPNVNSSAANQTVKAIVPTINKAMPKLSLEKAKKADELELIGFQYLLSKDFLKAAQAFADAEENKPGYHNCYELADYLKKNPNKDPKEIYKTILTSYSWGMPPDTKTQMKQFIESDIDKR
jgi:hypothetical protein